MLVDVEVFFFRLSLLCDSSGRKRTSVALFPPIGDDTAITVHDVEGPTFTTNPFRGSAFASLLAVT